MGPRCGRSVAWIALVWFGIGLLPAARGDDWPIARGPARELVPYPYDPGQWKSVPKEYLEDAQACILYSGTSYVLEPDGTVESVCHEITRLNGRKGIEKFGEYRSITFDPAFQKVTLNEARVLKANGRVVPIEPKHVQLRDMNTDYLMYDHEKQVIISFPNLEVGDVIEVTWTTRGNNPEYQGHYFTRYTFGDDLSPVVLDEMRFRLPKSRALRFASVGGKVEPTVAEDGDWRTYHWRVTNRRELPRDENLPSREELRWQVVCSTFASWEEVSQWEKHLLKECWKCTPEVQEVVKEVTRDLKTPLDKARALAYWVRRNVRYVSVGEKHDYTPHAPAVVLANRYGDCKDQSQLLAVMLREAGLPVGLVTLGTLGEGQILEQVPSPWGSHAIVLVCLDGKEHWIDSTVSLGAWNYLPRDDRDRVCYVTDEQGLRLKRTPASIPENNRIEQTTILTVAADGSSHSQRTCTYQGAAALAQRDEWMEVPPGERRRLMTSELQNANSKARLRRLAVDENKLRDFDQPVQAQLEFEIPGHFNGDTEIEGSLSDSPIWSKLLSYNLDYDRKVPLELGTPCESVHHYTVCLPPAFRFESLPRDQVVRSAWGSFKLRVWSPPDEFHKADIEFHLRLEKARVEPADFEAFCKFHETVFKHYRVWLTLKPTQDLDDAAALEEVLALLPTDGVSAGILAKLYCQNGKKAEARRVLERARSYHPDQAALWELAVKAAANLEEEESAYQELVHRFPEEPKYCLSLGETRVNRGHHAAARTVLQPLAEKGPSAVRGSAHYQLARSSFSQNKPREALGHLEAASRANLDCLNSVTALQFKGRVHERLGQAAEAIQAYGQALLVEPQSSEILAALVRLQLDADHRAEALEYLRRYTVVVSQDREGLWQAAEFNLRLNRLDEALDLASRAGEPPPMSKGQRVVGLVHWRRGDTEKAVCHLSQAEPDAESLEALIRAYLARGDLRQAEQRAATIDTIARPTESLRRVFALTIALAQRRETLLRDHRPPPNKEEQWTTAVDHLVCAEHALAEGCAISQVEALVQGAIVEGVEIGAAFALRGQLALEKGRLGKALADAERAVALSPNEARGYYIRGRVRCERADKAALADLARAAELSQRKDPWTLHWLATALAQAGRVGEALVAQKQAVHLRPQDAELADQLRHLEQVGDPGNSAGH